MRDEILLVLAEAARAVKVALEECDDWDAPGRRPSQYVCDLVAEEAAIEVLDAAGFGVASEECGEHEVEREVVVVLDPVDGTQNAIRGFPLYSTSMCAVVDGVATCALVYNLASGESFVALSNRGAAHNGLPLSPSDRRSFEGAFVAIAGAAVSSPVPQWRSLGCASLEMCMVASGILDAYICMDAFLAPYDYLGGLLVCQEAGAAVAEGDGRSLVVTDPRARRRIVAASTDPLLRSAMEYSSAFGRQRATSA